MVAVVVPGGTVPGITMANVDIDMSIAFEMVMLLITISNKVDDVDILKSMHMVHCTVVHTDLAVNVDG